ncbi:MAG: glycosyltransferase family 39 protein [Blastocatellia bacterium]|nr:glycosyltransferase family 39 protein [Blastocatellia bacterium]
MIPWLIRGFSYVTQDYVYSAFIVATLASVAAAIILYRLADLEHGREKARRAVWFLLIFPTSYFLHIPYTEGLFLALSVGCIYAARKDRWLVAMILGILACMTRANGLVLVPALGVEVVYQISKGAKWDNRWLLIGLIPAGFFVYLAVIYSIAGDPFAFIEIRKEFFYISSTTPWDGVQAAVGQLERTGGDGILAGVQELTFIVLGLVAGIAAIFTMRPVYSTSIPVNWLLIVSVTFVASIPRYTFSMFPIFILFSIFSKDKYIFAILSVISLLYLAFFSSLFGKGFWAF